MRILGTPFFNTFMLHTEIHEQAIGMAKMMHRPYTLWKDVGYSPSPRKQPITYFA